MVAAGNSSCSNSSRFGTTSAFKEVTPGTLLPGRFRLATSPTRTGSSPVWNTIGIVVVTAFAARAGELPPNRGNHGHLTPNQISGERRQSIILPSRPAIVDRHVAARDIADFAQPFAEGCREGHFGISRLRAEITDHRQCRLLRPHDKRPCRRTPKPRNKHPPSHQRSPLLDRQPIAVGGACLALSEGLPIFVQCKRRLLVNPACRRDRG
jgi:hypothetical protein